MQITLSSKWFSEIKWQLNSFDVEGLNSQKYHNYQVMGQQITDALTGCRSASVSGFGASAPLDAEEARLLAERARIEASQAQAAELMANAMNQVLESLQTTGISPNAKKVCPNCAQFCEGKFCQECGAEAVYAVTVQCSSCGCQIDVENPVPKFCPACGHKIDTGDLVHHKTPNAEGF